MTNIDDDLYGILGLPPDASVEQIHSAYRRLARQVHPDVAGPGAGTEFVRINQAYEILVDPDRRRQYDRRTYPVRRAASRRPVASAAWIGHPIFLNALLADVLSAMTEEAPPPADALVEEGPASARRVDVQPIHIELVLAPEVARTGTRVRLDLPVVITCRHCRGSGLAEPFVCPACRGRGRWSDTRRVEFFLAPPIRDGQVITLDLRALGVRAGHVSANIRLSWL